MFARHKRALTLCALVLVLGAAISEITHAKAPGSAPLLPAPTGTVINVSTEAQLQAAISQLASNTTIVIAPGTYHLSSSLYVNKAVSNVGIRGGSNDPNATVLIGPGMANANFGNTPYGIWTGGGVQSILIANLTLSGYYYDPIIFNAGTQSPHVYNVHMIDAGEQFIKSNPDGQGGGVNNGIVEYSTMEYTTTATSDYTNGVDVHTGVNWIIRHNLFRNIVAPAGQLAGPAVLMWNHSSGSITEGNTFINCARAIAYGMSQLTTGHDHTGGIIRNNFIYRASNQPGDVGISVADSPNTQVLNNTLLLSATYGSPIEYRFTGSTGVVITNNLLDGTVLARDGATGTVSHDAAATASMFVNPSAGDLHLKSTATSAIDMGVTVSNVTDDWDGNTRPAGAAYDLGADEYGASATSYSISGHVTDSSNAAVSGVTMTLGGSRTGTATTDSGGAYAFAGLASGGTFTVAATKSGSTFTPSQLAYSSLSANQTAANFTAAPSAAAPTVSLTAPVANATFNAPATIALTATASTATGTITKVDFYAGTTLIASDTSSPYSATWTNVATGTYTLSARATNSAGLITTSSGVSVTVGSVSTTYSGTPYSGTPAAVPGTIQAENYDTGGEGVAYHDTTSGNSGGAYRTDNVDIGTTTDAGGGYLVGWVQAGEWLNYTVNVATSGTYIFDARVASNGAGGTFHLLANNVNVTGTLTIPSTGGWQTWTDVTKTGVQLSAGKQVLRLVMDTNGATGSVGNFNWIKLTSTSTSTTTVTAALTAPAAGASFNAPATIALSANASTTSGSISKVEFFSGSTLIATDTSSPYTASWTNVAGGSYSLTAKATTSSGATATSAATSVTVKPSTTSPTPSGGLVQSANFVHAGTISLPTFSTDPAGYNYGGIALSYNPANNSLFIGGDQIATKVGELGLPAGTSGSATNLQAPADPFGGKVYGSGDSINPSSSNQRVVGGTLVYNGELIVTAYDYYDAQGTQVLSHFVRSTSLSGAPSAGPLRAGPLGAGFYSGYMGLIPSAWQAALGGPALTGNSDLSIISRTSYGPSISVFDPANINGTAVMLVGYPTAHQTLGGWGAESTYFGGSDSITGVVFPQNTSSVLFFGRHGTTFCYGPGTSTQSQAGQPADGGVDTYCYDPTSTDKGVHGYPYQASVWAYNANDLAAVKAGSKNPWDVVPYAIWSLPELGNSRIGGAAYDPATNRIFVSQMCTASGCPALIHVYQIQ